MFFQDWSDLGRLLAVGPPAHVALILLLRVSNKRCSRPDPVAAMVLEADGAISIIDAPDASGADSALRQVQGLRSDRSGVT